MATEEMRHKDMILTLKDAGYTDAAIALGLAALLPGTPIPSINSVRRWRYGSTQPSPYYAALLERFYAEAISQGIVARESQDDQ